jgi:pyruvate dehydrogenase E2 component (dihydrolipoamide acetyltransferase)
MLTVIEMPSLSSTMKKGKVVKWHKKEGEFVRKGEILFEVQTDKVNVEVDALVTGFLRKILLRDGLEAPVHTPIAVIAESMDEDISQVAGASAAEVQRAEEAVGAAPSAVRRSERPTTEEGERIRISPLARRIAEDKGIDIRSITGTGPEGRITKEDVERAVAERAEKAPLPRKPQPEAVAEGVREEYEDIELTPMRSIIAARLQQSKATSPHFYVDVYADGTALKQLRDELQKRLEKQGARITLNDILVKIVSHALREFPGVNASFMGERIRLHRAINIGLAVAVDEGLVVPIIRNADRKSISEISREAADLATRARGKRLLPQEYEGGTFTITNMGMFGVEGFHAIINPPESAILAVGAMALRPAVVEGEIVIRPMVKLCLSVDHRAVDGALGARFLARVRDLTESPLLMFA